MYIVPNSLNRMASETYLLPPWAWLLIILLITVIIIIALILNRETVSSKVSAHHDEPTSSKDDLTKIEGIGPVTQQVLFDAGITTYQQLAETSREQLQSILDKANLRLGVPETWAEQAALAAEGKWDELVTLQNNLKGGVRQ